MPHPDPKKQVQRFKLSIELLTFATAVFRAELAILLCTVTAYGVCTRAVAAHKVVLPFALAFALALLFSVPLDSYFWQRRLLWPELAGFYYNAVLGASSNWGTAPWHWYFTSALPRVLANPLAPALLVPLALAHPGTGPRARALALPSLLFVAIYSLQPHKEARFVFYAAPPLTAAAALGADVLFRRRARSGAARLAAAAVAASVPLSFAISIAMLLISALNYPGGEALHELRALVAGASGAADHPSPDLATVVVHTDVLSCMTGITLFGQHPDMADIFTTEKHARLGRRQQQQQQRQKDGTGRKDNAVRFVFDKTEDEATLRDPGFWDRFDYALAADPAAALGPYEVIGVVEGFGGLEIARPSPPPSSSSSSTHPNSAEAERDLETGTTEVQSGHDRVLGRGALVARLRDAVVRVTGGWWVGPRMVPQVHVLRRMREGEARRAVAE